MKITKTYNRGWECHEWRNYLGQLHREDGPAVECNNGDKYWFRNGLLHREDGPAVEYNNGDKVWNYRGKCIPCKSQQEFEKLIKLQAFW